MIWSGAGLHGTLLAFFAITWIFGIDPDESTAKFFLVLAPFLFVIGIFLGNLSYNLQLKWADEENQKGMGFSFNKICAFAMCDFSHPPTVFWIPMPLLSIVSLIISFIVWVI